MAFAVFIFLQSCKKQETQHEVFYFDTKAYFNKEKALLYAKPYGAQKMVELNGKTEEAAEKKVDTTEMQNYINVFNEANLNRPIYKGTYKIDTFWMLDPQTNENIEVLNYISQNPKNEVKWL
ncbi:MAG: hypothetical protein LRY27_01060, partial [Chitinophagales bacterium]|nr:hypothetical protein [Chitinophagales bacterium]